MAVAICRPQFCLTFAIHNAYQRPVYLLRRFAQSKEYSTKAERIEKRRELISDFKKGSNLAHIREFQRSGGKRFLAPQQLTRKEESESFPNLVGAALTGRPISLSHEFQNHVTLLLMAMRGSAQPMCDVYREAFHNNFKDMKTAKCIEINAVDSWFYGLFKWFVTNSLRKQVSNFRHDSYMCYYGTLQELSKQDLIGNMLVGHAFLIDRDGFVRWKACATPTEEELESMIKCTKLLMP